MNGKCKKDDDLYTCVGNCNRGDVRYNQEEPRQKNKTKVKKVMSKFKQNIRL